MSPLEDRYLGAIEWFTESRSQIGRMLYDLSLGARGVVEAIVGLRNEVRGLCDVLRSIESRWRDPSFQIRHLRSEKELWDSVVISSEDCKVTLVRLEARLRGITEGNKILARGFLRKSVMGTLLALNMKEILALRGRIQSHASAMQSALAMINL